MTEALADLLRRVEEATGPDREIDGSIALMEGWTFQKMKGDQRPYWRRPEETKYYQRSELLRYTASIDAAVALAERVLPEWRPEIAKHLVGFNSSPYWKVVLRSWNESFEAKSTTAPLALCAAILKAKAGSQ